MLIQEGVVFVEQVRSFWKMLLEQILVSCVGISHRGNVKASHNSPGVTVYDEHWFVRCVKADDVSSFMANPVDCEELFS